MPGYPADTAEAGRRLFRRWLGARYARAVTTGDWTAADQVGGGTLGVARRWSVALTVIDTVAADATLPWEAGRAAIEQRLDAEGRSIALFAPRGASLPSAEPGLSSLLAAVAAGEPGSDGRFEVSRPVQLSLRRVAREGSVVTALGGLAGHWAQFTNRVPGTFQLNATSLLRLPSEPSAREDLFERIVLAAGQPDVDAGLTVPAVDAWTSVDLEEGGSCVIGTPAPESDEWSSGLRRNLRRLLARANERRTTGADATALAVLGAATYSDDERLSWALKGMDPTLYAGYDFVTVIADGVVKPILAPAPRALPWDA